MTNLIKDVALATGATVSSTGGSALTLGVLTNGNNAVTLNVPADANKTARKFSFTSQTFRESTSNPSGFTLGRRQAVLLFPKTLASGLVVIDKLTLLEEISIETTAAEVLDYRKQGAQTLIDTNLTPFWVSGSTAT